MIEGGGLGVFTPDEVGPMDVQVPNGVVDIAVKDEEDLNKLFIHKNVTEEVVVEIENEVENDSTSVVTDAFKEVYNLLSENKQWYTNTLGRVKELEKLMKK